MDLDNDSSSLSSELSELDSEKEFADFDPTTMQIKFKSMAQPPRRIVPKRPVVASPQSPMAHEIHRSLLNVLKRVAPFYSSYSNMRELCHTLRLILNAWRALAEHQSSEKEAFQHEALRAADPRNEGVDNLRLLAAKVLVDALEEAEWGFRWGILPQKLEDQPTNRTMQDLQRGMRSVLSELGAKLEREGFSSHLDDTNSTRGVSLWPTYVPATGKQPSIPQLNDNRIKLAHSREDVEERSSNHPSRMSEESKQERQQYANRVHEYQQFKTLYAFVARDAAMNRRLQLDPNAPIIPQPGSQLPVPRQQSNTQAPADDLSHRLIIYTDEPPRHPYYANPKPPKGMGSGNRVKGPKNGSWSNQESLLALELRRDNPEWTGQRRLDEINRRMAGVRGPRSVHAMRLHEGWMRKNNKTIEGLEEDVAAEEYDRKEIEEIYGVE